MEDSVACKCGGPWEFKEGVLQCAWCTLVAPYQPAPTHADLLVKFNEIRGIIKSHKFSILKLGQIAKVLDSIPRQEPENSSETHHN